MTKEVLIYTLLKEKMEEHCDICDKEISVPKAKWVISRYNIPGCLRPAIIREMISLGYLKWGGKHVLVISSTSKIPLSKDFFEF